MRCKECGSYAINHSHHGRDGTRPDLCDVCFWRARVPTHRDVRATYSGALPHGQKLNIEVWLYPGQSLVVEDSFSPEPNDQAHQQPPPP